MNSKNPIRYFSNLVLSARPPLIQPNRAIAKKTLPYVFDRGIPESTKNEILSKLPPNLLVQDAAVFVEPKVYNYTSGKDVKNLDLDILQGPFSIKNLSEEIPVVGKITLADFVFQTDIRKDLLARMIRWQRAKKQQGTHKTKTKAEVSGTGKKPYPQKGTGRPRTGSLRNPHMRGGGVAHGPVVRSHEHKMNKAERRFALRSCLSARFQEGKFFIIDNLDLPEEVDENIADTLYKYFEKQKLRKVLLIDEVRDEEIYEQIKDDEFVEFLPAIGCNVWSILKKKEIVITVKGLQKLQEHLNEEIRARTKLSKRGFTPLFQVKQREILEKLQQQPKQTFDELN